MQPICTTTINFQIIISYKNKFAIYSNINSFCIESILKSLETNNTMTNTSNITAYKLELDNILVGVLYQEGELWNFEYSDQFKKPGQIQSNCKFPRQKQEIRIESIVAFFHIPHPWQRSVETQERGKLRHQCLVAEIWRKICNKSIPNVRDGQRYSIRNTGNSS